MSVPQGNNREETAEEDELPSKKRRSLCSSFEQPSVSARSKYVLLRICILCQRERKKNKKQNKKQLCPNQLKHEVKNSLFAARPQMQSNEIICECEAMAGKGEHCGTQTDLLQSRMKRDKTDVLQIVDTVNSMVNPFDYEQDELIHITSGVVTTQNVKTNLQSANARGESEFTKFCEQRLQTRIVDFFATMKKLNLKIFTSMSKIFRHNVHGKDMTLTTDRNLLARLIVMGRHRKTNLQELLSYSLDPLPLSLADSQGSLVKTNKVKLIHALESLLEKSLLKIPIIGGIYVVDMALLHQLNINKLSGERTFLNLSLVILKRLANWAKQLNIKEIYSLFDSGKSERSFS